MGVYDAVAIFFVVVLISVFADPFFKLLDPEEEEHDDNSYS